MGGRGAVDVAAAMWLGLLAGSALPSIAAVACLPLALALGALSLRAPDRVGTVALILAVLAASAGRGAGHRQRTESGWTAASEAETAWLRVRVVGHPWREAGEPSVVVRVEEAEGVVGRGSRLRIRLPPESAAEWGDRLEVFARLERPPPRRSPGGTSARDAAGAQGVVAQGRALFLRPSRSEPTLARATVARWRRSLEDVFARRLSPETREIVMPLVIGDRSGLGTELGHQLQAAGLTHLIALSGLHVLWMAAVARGAGALLGLSFAGRAWAGAACALLYVGIAGPLPSLMRAALAELLSAAAALRGRTLDPLQALALAACLLLAAAPGWAADLGFQLSCAATLGLVTIGRCLANGSHRMPGVLAWGARATAPTIAAQVASLPLVLSRFHCLPWTALGANLLAVPVCELLLAAAWLGAALELGAPGAGHWAFAACERLGEAMRAIAVGAARAPLALAPTGSSPWIAALSGAGALLLAGALSGPRSLRPESWPAVARRSAALHSGLLGLSLATALALTAPPLRPLPGRLWLVVLDVGQGDAIALGLGSGWWLVDAGPRTPRFDAGASVVLPFFRWASVRRLETLVLTHEHGDHVGGAAAVQRSLGVGRVVVAEGARGLRGARRARRGDTLETVPSILVRWPPAGFRSRDANLRSLVLEVREGDARAWLAADVDSGVEAELDAPALDWLKVAHHGASSSTGIRFLARARPRDAVISCGRNNPFGHPHPGTLERLNTSGARVHRTDRQGTLWFELGPGGAWIVPWRSPGEIPPPDGERTLACGGSLARAPAHW